MGATLLAERIASVVADGDELLRSVLPSSAPTSAASCARRSPRRDWFQRVGRPGPLRGPGSPTPPAFRRLAPLGPGLCSALHGLLQLQCRASAGLRPQVDLERRVGIRLLPVYVHYL